MKRSSILPVLFCTTFFSLFILLPPPSPLQAAEFQILEGKAAPVHQRQRAESTTTPAVATPQSRTAPVRLQPAARRIEQLRRLPDLSITRFSATPAMVKSSGKIHLTALVKNSGATSLKGIVVRFTKAGQREKLGEKVINIGPGKTSRADITLPITGKGQITVFAEVDPQKRITEGNERNNKKKTTVTVQTARMVAGRGRKRPARASMARPSGNVRIQEVQPRVAARSPVSPIRRRIQPRPTAADKPDLTFVKLVPVRKQVIPGQSVVIKATIRNNGTNNQKNIPVDFLLDGRKIGNRKVTIPANQTKTFIFRYTAGKSGNHSLVAKVDPGNRIQERNERNNSASISIVVSAKQQVAVAKGTNRPKTAAVSATIATRAATPISIPRPINPVGKKSNSLAAQRRTAKAKTGSLTSASRLQSRQLATQTHKVARASSAPGRVRPSRLSANKATVEKQGLNNKGEARTHNGPDLSGRGPGAPGSSGGGIGGLTAGGKLGGIGEPEVGNTPPLEDNDGLGDIFGGKGGKRPNDKIITPDQMTGEVDTISPAATLFGPGGKPMPGPGGIASFTHTKTYKGSKGAMGVDQAEKIFGSGFPIDPDAHTSTGVDKYTDSNGRHAYVFHYKKGHDLLFIEKSPNSHKYSTTFLPKSKKNGSKQTMEGSGDRGGKEPLSASEKRMIADARSAEAWNAVNNYIPIQNGGVVDPVRNQANSKGGGPGAGKSKGQAGGKKAPMAAHAPGSHRPGSSLTGPGRVDRDPVGKEVKLPQGVHVVDPMAKNGISFGRAAQANKSNSEPVQTKKGGQTHSVIAMPGTAQLKHASSGSKIAATPISIPRTPDAVSRNKPSTRVNQIKLDPEIGPNRSSKANPENFASHPVNKKLHLRNPATYDSGPIPINLRPSITLQNGVYYGDGMGVKVKIVNTGVHKSPPFTVGFGKEKNGRIESNNAWLGKLHVPGVFGGQHVIVTIPWQIHTTGKSRLIVGVDIEGKVAEDNEEDNYSKPFIYNTQTASVAIPPDLPVRKPFKAFDIIQPRNGERFRAGDDVRIGWYATQTLMNIPTNEKSEFSKLDIFLFDNTTSAIVARLAEDARNSPIGFSHYWRVTLPENMKEGDYYLLLRTPSGTGWGKSDVFTVWHQQTATLSAMNKQNSILSHQAEINPAAVTMINIANDKTAPKVSIQYLDSVIHTKPHAAGQPAEVEKVVSKYKITTDREIMIVRWDTAFTKPPAIPVYSPEFFLAYTWYENNDPGYTPLNFFNSYFVGKPVVEWQPQGGYSVGTHILNVTFHLTNIKNHPHPFCALKLCYHDDYGLIYDMPCENLDFVIWTGIQLGSDDYIDPKQGPQIILRDTGPRKKVW